MSEFLTVSKNLEIKELSTGIELNDQYQTTSDHVESNENNVADENIDIAGVPPHALHDDGGNVETQAKIELSSSSNAANARVRSTKDVSGEAKFQCKDCDRIFNSDQALRYHTKSKHEGVKYACNQCDQQFTHQSNLTTHIQSQHEGVKYACNQCDQQFTQASNLRTHIKIKHQV